MAPECSVLCIDNSEWMRNADYCPTRFHSLYDAANIFIQGKSRDNVENSFSVLSLTGFELLCSLTTDQNKILSRIHTAPIKGTINFIKALKIAELVLEQREIKENSKRILAFIGSPCDVRMDEACELACKFMENNVAVDIILFGEYTNETFTSLQSFINILNDCPDPKCHFISVDPGDSISRVLRMSEIMPTTQRTQSAATDFDFDAENDPDLAEAIRLSLQEQGIDPNSHAKETQKEMIEEFEDVDFSNMTEDQQIELAMRLSLRDEQEKKKANEDEKNNN